jgi:hypothetical protein
MVSYSLQTNSEPVSPCEGKRRYNYLHANNSEGSEKENDPSGEKPAKRQRKSYHSVDLGPSQTLQEIVSHAKEVERQIIQNLEETQAILREILAIIQKL